MSDLLCPLKFGIKGEPSYCDLGRCAWYDNDGGMCCVKSIEVQLYKMG